MTPHYKHGFDPVVPNWVNTCGGLKVLLKKSEGVYAYVFGAASPLRPSL